MNIKITSPRVKSNPPKCKFKIHLRTMQGDADGYTNESYLCDTEEKVIQHLTFLQDHKNDPRALSTFYSDDWPRDEYSNELSPLENYAVTWFDKNGVEYFVEVDDEIIGSYSLEHHFS